MAADLVRRRVDVIVTTGGLAAARAAKAATTTVPIVFQFGSDPVALGLVESLNRPGGNITDVSVLSGTLAAKRLEVLHEAVPTATTIGFLVDPTNPDTGRMEEMEIAARTLGVNLLIVNASSPSEIEAAFGTLAQRQVGALIADASAFYFVQGEQLAGLAARYALPAIYHAHEISRAGGFMSYGASFFDAWRLAGTYAARILKGAKPGDLPVQQSTKVELAINLKTAKALGLTIPLPLLGRADEVIE